MLYADIGCLVICKRERQQEKMRGIQRDGLKLCTRQVSTAKQECTFDSSNDNYYTTSSLGRQHAILHHEAFTLQPFAITFFFIFYY